MKQFSKTLKFMLLCCIAYVMSSCSQNQLKKITIEGKALGTFYTIHLYSSENDEQFVNNLKSDIDSVLTHFNSIASIYQSNSTISLINSGDSVIVDDVFSRLFILSQEVYKMSGGAFDITIAPLVNAWGFGFEDSLRITQKVIDSLLVFVGMEKMSLNNDLIVKSMSGVSIDMNGIAKGYAVDLVSDFLLQKGIGSYIVEIGGEVRVGKTKPDGNPWFVAIEKPAPDRYAAQEIEQRLCIEEISLATSGSYRRYYEKDGKRYSHTIDPFTGYPVQHQLLSATILADNCALADALATACMVLGIEKSLSLCESIDGVEGYFIASNSKGSFDIHYSSGFKKYFCP
jgi:FAD:protein FMN transferase